MHLALIFALLAAAAPAAALPLCGAGPRENCVVDGDTIWLAGEKIRLLGIDAPELTGAKCAAESALARQAAERLAALTQGRIVVAREGTDRYGRTLARLSVAAGDLGGILIAEGLARPWTGRRESWCR